MVSSRSQRAGAQAKRPLGLADPASHGAIAAEVEAALMRQPCVGQQRDIGERDGIADQKSGCGKLVLHPGQRGVTTLDFVGVEIGCGFSEINHLKAAHRDIGLVTILLPEQPLIHFRGCKCVGGNKIAAAGKVSNDGVGFRERPAVVEFNRRHLAGAVEFEKLRGAGFALERIDADPGIGQREPVADPFHFKAVARIGIAVDFHQLRGLPTEAASDQPHLFLSSGPRAARVRTYSRSQAGRCSSRSAYS